MKKVPWKLRYFRKRKAWEWICWKYKNIWLPLI